jgi:2'-5' RNA ligase
VRYAIRAAIGEVWGKANVPEAAEGWRPHVSLAYANTAGQAAPITEALAAQPAHTAEIEISTVSLIDLNRDNKAYEWSDVATVRLGNN